jgi:V-type H+-transporting ATPase subunit C
MFFHRYGYQDWQSSYSSLTEFVLPDSSKKIVDDGEYGLFTVTLFKKFVDDYKNMCREKRYVL